MKRILISVTAVAVLIAGCGSGGSTTPVATHQRTTTTKQHKPPKKHKKTHKRKHKRKPVKKHRTKPRRVATTATTTSTTTATTTAVTTTTVAPTTTHTVAPTVTHQTTTHKKSKGGGGGGNCSHGCYCLSVADLIGTPNGSVPVAAIRPGMRVWSTDTQGRRISVKVLRIHHRSVPLTHMMVRLRLADGRTVSVSPSHPLADGSAVRTLAAGERFEGTRVVSAARVRYGRPYTYDILPAGSTHTYYADGVLLGSTLAPPGMYLSRPF